MKIFTRLLEFIYILIGLFAISFLSFSCINHNLIITGRDFLDKEILNLRIFGFSLIIVSIIWIVYWSDYKIKTKNITFNNPHGKVQISLNAIEEFISTRITAHIKNIKTLKVKTSISSYGLETLISLTVSSGYNIPELSGQIQELIKNYLQDVVGIERISHIHIQIENIIAEADMTSELTKEKDEQNP